MNIKKTFGIGLSVVLFLLYSCGDTTKKESTTNNAKSNQTAIIAKLEKGKLVFTDKEKLIAQLESELVKSKITGTKLTGLIIDYSKAADTDKVEIIQLIGSNEDGTVQISYQLNKSTDGFRIMAKNTVVVCEGCRDGCSPRRKSNGDGYCTKCTYQGTKKCVKTESLPSLAE